MQPPYQQPQYQKFPTHQQPQYQQFPPHQQPQQQYTKSRPGRLEAFRHPGKTFKFIWALLTDPRILISRKALFIIGIGALLSLLPLPNAVAEFILSIAIPFVGTIAGIPANIGADWMAIILLFPVLFNLFPDHIMAEHYQWIFHCHVN